MIATIFIYFLILIAIALYSQRRNSAALDYFLGGRKLGVIPLAMTTAATYVSASSFIGGPGMAYKYGLSWVFLATVQYPVGLLMMGILGNQLQSLGQKHGLYDLPDYIGLRYGSRLYQKFCAGIIAIVLLLSLIVAIMGGSRLLQGALAAWQLNYPNALLIFSLTLATYTLLGGFRAVVLTDILQGIWMLLASLILLFFLWHRAGGANGLEQFSQTHAALFRPDSGGKLPLHYTINFTILVGFGMIAHPVSFSRLLALEKGKSLRNSIFISIAVIGLLTFLPHLIGFLGRIVLPGIAEPDQLMGRISQLFQAPQYGWAGKVFSGMLISAMLAAIMSSADSALNTLGLTIYRHLLPRSLSSPKKNHATVPSEASPSKSALTGIASPTNQDAENRHFQLSRLLAGGGILLAAIFALKPPQLLVALNLYALGSTQVTLLWPVVLGMYTRRPDARSACSSSLAGLAAYGLLNRLFPSFGGAALLPYCLLISGISYWVTAVYTTRFSPRRPI
ncbi:MAG: hypothetical protein AAF975_01190 [Spirochaetota bacterium]